MKKIILVLLMALVAVSCSRKVEVSGKILGASPMERIEFIQAAGITTLPLVNLGVSPNGEFKGSFEAPDNGIYVMTYAQKYALIYLKKGQSANISANAMTFPEGMKITGDAQKNNDFLQQCNKAFQQYTSKINVGEELGKDEAGYLASTEKIYNDSDKKIDEIAKKTGADSDAVQWQKDELAANILKYTGQYEMNHAQMIGNPAFKVTSKFKDFEKKLSANHDRMIKTLPEYRSYLLDKMAPDFQKFAASVPQNNTLSVAQVLAKYLKTKKDIDQTTKDYLLAFVASHDLAIGDYQKELIVNKLADQDIKDVNIRNDVKKVALVLGGFKPGTEAPSAKLTKQDGSSANFNDLKGKPTLVMFYSSWNPGIAQSVTPVVKEVANFYKSKMNFAYIDLDDTKEQFTKTSKALLQGFPGTNYYAEGGLNSELAKAMGIYSFKLPGFVILDKDGKFVGKYYKNLGEEDFVSTMDKVSGLQAPKVDPNVQLQVGADALRAQQQAQQQMQNQPPPPPQPQPSTK